MKVCIGSPNNHIVKESLRVNKEKDTRNREKLLSELSKVDFKYYCAMCLIIRDEREYLEEWLIWHIKQGVQHFYIYDHGSKEPVKDFIQSIGTAIADKVTVIDWSGSHKNAQPEAYNDCLNRFATESRWIGFIDTDEHVHVKTEQTLPEFLRDYEEFAGLFAVWIMYNANGHKNKTNASLRERFTEVSHHNRWADRAGKVFVQPLLMHEMIIHNGEPKEGCKIVGEWKDFVPEYVLVKDDASTDLICVDHYYTKSYEEWLEKLKRGSGHADFLRGYDDFFKYNPDMEYCREEVNIVQEYEVSKK